MNRFSFSKHSLSNWRAELPALHQRLYQEAQNGQALLPMICYALNPNYLSDELYTTFLQTNKTVILQNCYKKGAYGILLCLVRAFYEASSGKNWKQVVGYDSEDIKEQNELRNRVREVINNRQNPWSFKQHDWKVEPWLKTQCFILKAYEKGKNSIIVKVNRVIDRMLREKKVRRLHRRADWELLAHMNEQEVADFRNEFLLETEYLWEEVLRHRLKALKEDPQRSHARYLWQHFRFEWMMGLAALCSSEEDIPPAICERWPWLRRLVEQTAVSSTPQKRRFRAELNAYWALRRNDKYSLCISIPRYQGLQENGYNKLELTQAGRKVTLTGLKPNDGKGLLIPMEDLGGEGAIDLRGDAPIEVCIKGSQKDSACCTLQPPGRGVLVFRHVNGGQAVLHNIPEASTTRTPSLNLVLMHRPSGAQSLSIVNERQSSAQAKRTDLRPKGHIDNAREFQYSEVDITRDAGFNKQPGVRYQVSLHDEQTGISAPLFYALWTPRLSFSPEPNSDLRCASDINWKIIEMPVDETTAVTVRREGGGLLHVPTRLDDEEDTLSPIGCVDNSLGDSVAAARYAFPLWKPYRIAASKYGGLKAPTANSPFTFSTKLAEHVVLCLPPDWRRHAQPVEDVELWANAQRQEEQYRFAEYSICDKLRRTIWRWHTPEGPRPCGEPLPAGQAAEAMLEFCLPEGQRSVEICIGRRKARLSREERAGISLQSLHDKFISFTELSPGQEVSILLLNNGQQELLFRGPYCPNRVCFRRSEQGGHTLIYAPASQCRGLILCIEHDSCHFGRNDMARQSFVVSELPRQAGELVSLPADALAAEGHYRLTLERPSPLHAIRRTLDTLWWHTPGQGQSLSERLQFDDEEKEYLRQLLNGAQDADLYFLQSPAFCATLRQELSSSL